MMSPKGVAIHYWWGAGCYLSDSECHEFVSHARVEGFFKPQFSTLSSPHRRSKYRLNMLDLGIGGGVTHSQQQEVNEFSFVAMREVIFCVHLGVWRMSCTFSCWLHFLTFRQYNKWSLPIFVDPCLVSQHM